MRRKDTKDTKDTEDTEDTKDTEDTEDTKDTRSALPLALARKIQKPATHLRRWSLL